MKTVLITGAAGGLGICLAREYLSRSYMVFGVDVVQQHSETDRLFEEANGQFVFFSTRMYLIHLRFSTWLSTSVQKRKPWIFL